eukprot:g12070.t1
MVHLGTLVSGVGLLTLLHAGFSAAHFQQFKKSSGSGDSVPLDATLEAIAGFFVCVVGVLYSTEAFLPIRGAAGGGKSLDSAESTREFEFKRSLAVEDAALLVLEAMEGVYRAKPLPTVWSRRCHHFAVNLKPVAVGAVMGLVVLTFFEYPAWCNESTDLACDDHGVGHPPPYLPFRYGQVIEAVLLLPPFMHQVVNAIAYRLKMAKFVVLDVALLVYAVDLIVAAAYGNPGIRVAPYMRALLLVGYSPDMMAQVKLFGRILAEFASILSVVAMFLGFFAWFGNVTFAGEERSIYFPNFVDACWNLLVMLTTANFPDVMMPAFTQNRGAGLLFFPVVVFGVFILMNFLLASTYEKYSHGHKELLDKMLHLRDQNCTTAFDLLVEKGESNISASVMEELLAEVNLCSGAGAADLDKLAADQKDLLIQLMDNNQDNGINKNEFKAIITLLQLRFEKVSPETFVSKWFPDLFYSGFWQRLCEVIKHPWFEYGVDVVLIVNAILLLVESAEALSGEKIHGREDDISAKDNENAWLEAEGKNRGLNSILGWLYILEMTLKILVFGWKGYWSKNRNRFDGVITLGGILTEVLLNTTTISSTLNLENMVVYFITFRLLRVARLMIAFPEMRIVMATFGNIAPEAFQFMLLLFVCMFTFCVLGVQLFGGLVLSDPDNPANEALKDSSYGQSGYWAINFNDMPSGMGCLFCLLVVNNWFLFVDVFVAASGGNKWNRWFFVAFYLFGVLVILNVVIAVVLENFILQWTARRERRAEKMHFLEEHAHDHHEEVEGHRTSTMPQGAQYKVRLASSVKMIEKDDVIKRFLQLENRDGVAAVSGSTDPAEDPLGESLRRLLGGFASFASFNDTNTTYSNSNANSSANANTSGEATARSSALLADNPNPVADRVVGTLRRRSSVDEDTILLTTGVTAANYGGSYVGGDDSNTDA